MQKNIIETERLLLRPLNKNDFAAVHSYGSDTENVLYMQWGPNTEEETHAYIQYAIEHKYTFAVTLKDCGKQIGSCAIHINADVCDGLGWILHKDYWKQGYGTEMGKALLRFGFDELGLRRITAACDTENTGSYKLMEKIGMRREGFFHDARPPHKKSNKPFGDEYQYAMLKDEWGIQKEIAYYNALPFIFDDFIDVPELSDGVIRLFCYQKSPAEPEKKWVPGYNFAICKDGEQAGQINLRIGYTDGLYYGGQIGYDVYEKFRGNGYAGRACKLVATVAKAHGMQKLIITNKDDNRASARVCEKLGAKLIRVARLPEWTDMYKMGSRFNNIFEWRINHG